MSTNAPHTPGEFGEPLARTAPARGPAYYVRKGLKALASLQLTVVLFALGILLIFFGTVAQLDFGIWTVVDKYFWSWVVQVPFDLFAKFLNVFWKEKFPDGTHWSGTFPFPAGKLIGALMLVNLLAAHATRFRLSWKRSGIFLIHGGMILLFVGEFITREYAVEQQMVIVEGESSAYAQDVRHVEYALIDKSDPKADRVVVIPENVLKSPGGRITHPDLPVDVEVVGEYMVNAKRMEPKTGQRNPADSGVGRSIVVTAEPEVSGLDEKRMNFPAVYLKFLKKGTDESLGTYLASLYVFQIGGFDEVPVGDKKYEGVLRFKRYYKPYRIHLDKFTFDRYVGTTKAKNFSSDVRLYDESGNLVRSQRIAMNEPMRYAGETFYQADFDKQTEKATVLQVVKNPGWLLPYISCVVVGLGLALHFGIHLLQFLRRGQPVRAATEAAPTATADPVQQGQPLPWGVRYLPSIIVGVLVLYLLSVYGRMTPPKEPVDYRAASAMLIYEGGRPKPLDSLARVNLRIVSGREEVEDKTGKKQPAIRWYLDAISAGGLDQKADVWESKLVRIDNEQVLQALELKPVDGLRYTVAELLKKREMIVDRGEAAEQKADAKQKLDQTEMKFKELYDRLQRVNGVAMSSGPQLPPREYPPQIAAVLRRSARLGPPSDKQPENEKWIAVGAYRAIGMRETTVAAMVAAQKKIEPRLEKLSESDEVKLLDVMHVRLDELKPEEREKARERLVALLKADSETMMPEMRRIQRDAIFALLSKTEKQAILDGRDAEYRKWLAAHPAALAWEDMIDAYRDKKSAEFTKALDDWRAAHAGIISPKEVSRTRVELMMNQYAPFYQCTGLYVLAFVLTVIGFTQQAAGRPHWASALRRSATYVLVGAFVVHTIALIARMYVMDRPMVFVTNLYGSAVFIGWGCVLLCLALEKIFPLGAGNVLAAVLGLATTIVAHNLAVDDTMEMVVAVLDTNFWLATHVTTVTLGYTATFVAGFLGSLYVLQMLGAVVRDSFLSKGEPTVGELLAFGVATTGSVSIPLFMVWFLTTALDKFEVLPSFLLWTLFGVLLVAGVLYAIGLMLMRVGTEGVDAEGKPLAGRVPGLAQPLVAMALTPERGKIFGQMVYGVVCFATLLSFVGTVLGGIWADQSWGRFWGWDPKENGAVLIVLWNTLILHARWAGLVKDRGVAVLAIFGNTMTAWSWFGTNQLGIGLHAYGFDTRLADGCFNFWVSQLLILGLGLIPSRFWPGAARRAAVATASAAAPAPTSGSDAPAPTASQNASANGAPPANPNGKTNGQPNGPSRRDKKKHGKKR